ncbi:MAG: arylsulfatase, partial [Gemmatimonadota bacterium]
MRTVALSRGWAPVLGGLCIALIALISLTRAAGAQDRPNILVVWGDDVGQSNVSAYTMGVVGYRTPNIDRIANEGMIFTDYYGEQSCTAGRSSFITGQSVFRTGLSKVGLPGADLGLQIEDPTIAVVLKDLGYATGQFGKNHLGDRDEFLPTNHGFDEFLGNLYHLNAEEEPENEDYPGDMVLADGRTFQEAFGPRGVIHSWANPDGTQRIEDTGPLTKKRMETIDEETVDAAIRFIRDAEAAGKPWFVWWNGTRMHFRTHVKEGLRGISGQDEYADGMVEHDMHIGMFLDLLDELGIVDETIVFYSTDNGPHMNTWPDAAWSPFRGEKNTNWEGGWRVPAMVRWPGRIPAGSVTNEIVHHMDWLPTFLSAAGEPGIKEKLKKGGVEAIGRTYKVHLDGYDILPLLTGKAKE